MPVLRGRNQSDSGYRGLDEEDYGPIPYTLDRSYQDGKYVVRHEALQLPQTGCDSDRHMQVSEKLVKWRTERGKLCK